MSQFCRASPWRDDGCTGGEFGGVCHNAPPSFAHPVSVHWASSQSWTGQLLSAESNIYHKNNNIKRITYCQLLSSAVKVYQLYLIF